MPKSSFAHSRHSSLFIVRTPAHPPIPQAEATHA